MIAPSTDRSRPAARLASNALLAVFLCCLVALPLRADEVDEYMLAQLRKLHIPGASLAVVHEGRIVKAQGYGLADLQLKAPASKFLNTATGKSLWQWFAWHGELKSFSFQGAEQTDTHRILRYRVLLGENAYWFCVSVTRDGKIAQIQWW